MFKKEAAFLPTDTGSWRLPAGEIVTPVAQIIREKPLFSCINPKKSV